MNPDTDVRAGYVGGTLGSGGKSPGGMARPQQDFERTLAVLREANDLADRVIALADRIAGGLPEACDSGHEQISVSAGSVAELLAAGVRTLRLVSEANEAVRRISEAVAQ